MDLNNLNNICVTEEKPDHAFRTEIPNIILKCKLNPFDLALYLHLKSIAGDNGSCWKSIANLAADCQMSENSIRKSLKNLCKNNKFLKIPLIFKERRKDQDGKDATSNFYINPIWRLNGDHYRSLSVEKGRGTHSPNWGSNRPPRVHVAKGEGARGEPKQDLLEEAKEQTNERASPVVCSSIKDDDETKIKKEMFKPFNLPYAVMISLLKFSITQIQDGLAAFRQYRAKIEKGGGKIDNPIGAIQNAIRHQWKPNSDKAACAEFEERRKQEKILYNREATRRILHDQDSVQYTIHENSVALRGKKNHIEISYLEDNFIRTLKYYIQELSRA